MKLITSVAVGSGGAATIDFTSIPATYTDLVILLSARGTQTGSAVQLGLQFNSDTGTNYASRYWQGEGSGAPYASAYTSQNMGYPGFINASGSTANIFSQTEIHFTNYTLANKKIAQFFSTTENSATYSVASLGGVLWNNTSAITAIRLLPVAGNFAQYTNAYLYGISKGSGGATVS